MSYDTEWSDYSLVRLQERLAAPLPKRPRPRPPEPPRPAEMSPAQRAALMASVKPRALPAAAAVRSRDIRQVNNIVGPLTEQESKALLITTLAAADPTRLLLVVQSPDDGLPAGGESEGAA